MKISKSFSLSILGSVIFSLSACSFPPGWSSPSGIVKLGINFPQSKGFTIKAIPENTQEISISITGEGIPTDTPLTQSVKRTTANAQESVALAEVPVGPKEITVKALGSDQNILAQATKSFSIEGGKINRVEIELADALKDLTLKLNNYPSGAGFGFIEYTPSGGKAEFVELNTPEIKLTKIPYGTLKIRSVVFDSNGTPLAVSKQDLKVENSTDELTSNMEKVTIPEVIDLDVTKEQVASGALKGLALLTKFVPQSLLGILDSSLIKSANNTQPKFSNYTVKANGRQLTQGLDLFFRAKSGETIEISTNVTDEQNDPLTFFWAITALSGEKYQMNIQPERSNIITRSLPIGENFVGFIVTDRKSYTGPITIPIIIE